MDFIADLTNLTADANTFCIAESILVIAPSTTDVVRMEDVPMMPSAATNAMIATTVSCEFADTAINMTVKAIAAVALIFAAAANATKDFETIAKGETIEDSAAVSGITPTANLPADAPNRVKDAARRVDMVIVITNSIESAVVLATNPTIAARRMAADPARVTNSADRGNKAAANRPAGMMIFLNSLDKGLIALAKIGALTPSATNAGVRANIAALNSSAKGDSTTNTAINAAILAVNNTAVGMITSIAADRGRSAAVNIRIRGVSIIIDVTS